MKILIILVLISLVACRNSNNYNNVHNMDNIKEILISQLKDGNSSLLGDEFESHKYSEKDLKVTIPLIKEELLKNDYIFPTSETYIDKIYGFFGRHIDTTSQKDFLYVDLVDKCNREPIYSTSSIYLGFFIVKKDFFITELYAIPYLINYEEIYPDIKDIENEDIIRKDPDLGGDMKVPHWKETPNLKEQRKKNIETLVARNKYLFNDNKDSFEWLIKNDAFFMESLVKKFGYTGDKELLEWVIKKTHYNKNRPEDYGSLFWVKNCDGSIKIHSNTFKVLQKLYNVKTAYQILEDIKGYINYLGDEEQSKKEELTEEQRIKILANIAYFGEQYKYTDNSPYQMMGRLRYFLRDSQVDILIKNKYFNLPKFKEWWDKADYDEYYVTECEYEGSCGPGYHPLSEKEWRAQQKEE